MKKRLAAVQFDILLGKKEANLEKAGEMIKQASEMEADIACLPEVFSTGFSMKNIRELAEEIPGRTTEFLSAVSRKNKIGVIGSIVERQGKRLFNTCVAIDSRGRLAAKYRKIHLFRPFMEDRHFEAGCEPVCNDFEGLKIGLMICYDIRFPELARCLALKGAQVIFVPAEFPCPKRKVWETLLAARAIENQLYVVGVNRIGRDKACRYFGGSMIAGPSGEKLASCGGREKVSVAEIDTGKTKEAREAISCFSDRRPKVYSR